MFIITGEFSRTMSSHQRKVSHIAQSPIDITDSLLLCCWSMITLLGFLLYIAQLVHSTHYDQNKQTIFHIKACQLNNRQWYAKDTATISISNKMQIIMPFVFASKSFMNKTMKIRTEFIIMDSIVPLLIINVIPMPHYHPQLPRGSSIQHMCHVS